MKKIAFNSLLAAGAVAFGMAGATSASAETTFSLSSWLPPSHPIVAKMIVPWARQVEQATKGNVKIKILAKPLGKPPAHFDLARQGQADISYGVHAYTPGRFLLTQAAEFAFLGDKAEDVSVAYWRIYKKHLEKADENKGVQVLGIFTHGPGQMFNSKRAINKVSDLRGLKIRVGGGAISAITKGMGATVMQASATKAYELMSNGVADGTFFPTESIKSFKLTKFVKYGTLVPGGVYNTSFFLVMNPKKFAGLSAADQKAMMKVSGESFARLSGKAWDAVDAAGVAAMKAAGIELTNASKSLINEIKMISDPIERAWVAKAKSRGVNGTRIMADLRAEIAKVARGN